jgi:hypothetical protein
MPVDLTTGKVLLDGAFCIIIITIIIIIIIVHSIRLFLRAFANFRKEIIGFANPVRQSLRTERLGSHWTDFS